MAFLKASDQIQEAFQVVSMSSQERSAAGPDLVDEGIRTRSFVRHDSSSHSDSGVTMRKPADDCTFDRAEAKPPG